MTRFLLAFSLMLPSWAMAQTLTVNANSQSTVTFGAGNCGASFTATYTLSAAATATYCGDVQFYGSTSSSCTGTDGGTISTFTPTGAGVTAVPFTVNLSQLPGLDSASCNAPGGVNVTAYVCGFGTFFLPGGFGTTNSCTNNQQTLATSPPITVIYQGKAPDAPEIPDSGVGELDGELTVDVSTPLNVVTTADAGVVGLDSTTVFYSQAQGDGGWSAELSQSASGSHLVDLTGLTNEVQYRLVATVKDTAGNESQRSAPALHTPHATVGFFAAFKNAGGASGGGCSTGAGSGMLVTGLMLAWLLRRKV